VELHITVNVKDYIPILYRPGEYGSYLFWVLNNFTNSGMRNNQDLPFTATGNAHDQVGAAGSYYDDWLEFLTTESEQRFYRMHYHSREKLINEQNAVDNISKEVNQFIIMQTLENNWLLRYYNIISKIKNRYPQFDNCTTAAGFREQLSFNLFQFDQMVKLLNIPKNAIIININDLLYNFEMVLNNLIQELGISLTEDMEVIMQNHNTMISKQKHLVKIRDINIFLKNFVNHNDCKLLDGCSIIDEAYIQYYLREELQLELRCDDIGDHFPKTVNELWRYTYKIGQ